MGEGGATCLPLPCRAVAAARGTRSAAFPLPGAEGAHFPPNPSLCGQECTHPLAESSQRFGSRSSCSPLYRCETEARRGGVASLHSQLEIAGGGGEPDVSAWRDLTSRLQKGPLRWSTPKWANPNDAAGEEQQAKLSCPLDALCPCPGVPSVLPRHLGVTLSWENTVCPSSQLLVGLLQDMFWAILSFPESYNGTSHLSSHTWSVRCRHSEFCPLGGSPEEEGGGAVLPPLLIGPTAIITPPHPPVRTYKARGSCQDTWRPPLIYSWTGGRESTVLLSASGNSSAHWSCPHKAFPRPSSAAPPGLGKAVCQSELRCPWGLLEVLQRYRLLLSSEKGW